MTPRSVCSATGSMRLISLKDECFEIPDPAGLKTLPVEPPPRQRTIPITLCGPQLHRVLQPTTTQARRPDRAQSAC
jgi:hypothetical protein